MGIATEHQKQLASECSVQTGLDYSQVRVSSQLITFQLYLSLKYSQYSINIVRLFCS